MKIRILVLLIAGLLSSNLLSAQNVGKRIENRAKHRAESKVNREVDKTVDKALDNVFDGLFGKKKKKKKTEETKEGTVPEDARDHEDSEAYEDAEAQRRAQAAIAGMMGGEAEDWEPVKNDFPISFDMSISTEKKGKTTTTDVEYTFDTWVLGMKMKQENEEEMLMLLDNEKGTMTTVVEKDGKRQGYRMNRGMFGTPDMDEVMEDVKITPTGNTKMIDGYFCREYLIESEAGTTTNAWLTKEVQADMNQLYSGFISAGKGKKQDNSMMIYQNYGVLIEATTVDEDRQETSHIKVSNIKTGDQINRGILDVSDVEIMGIGN
ncbi:hypothetical protein [Flavilitoribacter nigricans]|uniref:DUF4412 domain-containing protein n=1 Tax=Flavilitoribacter nigricans (strain ATCC 23147 / DSM 23189 / NBRC 102662 / NCIMB 1420 / SS-2) TaxID=1122177 RepID=A0A2D0NG98_FLAN2|nr:hypothetical protein [Flavilitoribacter nigricans]PHN07438.1 hypothetical protein CRP01_07370 [Flavilitoribacter nigricans DSM 23189 = NBRC 102662]